MKAITLLLILFMTPLKVSASSEKNILVIFSYVPSSWNTNGLIGIKKAFQSNGIKANMFEYVYDNLKVRKLNLQEKEIIKIKNLIEEKNINGIVIFDDEASDDLVQKLLPLKLPISTTGINKEKDEIKWLSNKKPLSVVYERYPFEKSLKLLNKMDRSIKRIKILTTDNESSNKITNQLVKLLDSYDREIAGIRLDDVIRSKSWEKWKEVILKTNKKDEALWILVPWNVYKDGEEVDLREMGRFYQKNSKVPAIGIVDINTQMGFLASFYVHSEDLGYQAGVNLITHMKNTSQANLIEETVKKTRFVINKERMMSLGLNIPLEVLDMATIHKKVELKVKR